jgi:hypothetical protein
MMLEGVVMTLGEALPLTAAQPEAQQRPGALALLSGPEPLRPWVSTSSATRHSAGRQA